MIKLYNENCLDVLKTLPSESIDLVVTDCPYHIVNGGCSKEDLGGIFSKNPNSKHQILGGMLNEEQSTYVKSGKLFKFNDIEFSEYVPELYRILKNGTHCYIMINARNLKDLWEECEKAGFEFQQLLVWNKGNAVVNKFYMNCYELILMMRKGEAKPINQKGTPNILTIPNIIGVKTHPTEKPVQLNKTLILNSSKEGDVVLDCFMGTGSCGVAAQELGRDFIGIELDEKYFNIAKERIEGQKKTLEIQMSIFDIE